MKHCIYLAFAFYVAGTVSLLLGGMMSLYDADVGGVLFVLTFIWLLTELIWRYEWTTRK